MTDNQESKELDARKGVEIRKEKLSQDLAMLASQLYKESSGNFEINNQEDTKKLAEITLKMDYLLDLQHEQLTATQQKLDVAVEALKWQPIKTAPKDGVVFLGRNGENICLCRWRKTNMRNEDGAPWHNLEMPNYHAPYTDHWEQLRSKQEHYGIIWHPTHWMALPIAPTNES